MPTHHHRHVLRTASAVVFIALGVEACAVKRVPNSNDLRPTLTQTERAIAAARIRLDSALARADTAAAIALLDDSVEVYRGSTLLTTGASGAAATLTAMSVANERGAILMVRRESESCLASGYELGMYTVYGAATDGSRISVSGPYAIGWRVHGNRAVVRSLVFDRRGEFQRPPRAVSCVAAATLVQRSSPFGVSAAGLFSNWPALQRATSASTQAGWSQDAKSTDTNGAPCSDAHSSLMDETRLQLSARERITPRIGAEIVAAPGAAHRCTRGLNRATATVVTQSLELSDGDALLNFLAGDFRLGAGLAYTHMQLRALEDSVGSSAWHRARVSTSGHSIGVAGQVAYSFSVSSRLYGELASRVWLAPAIRSEKLLNFTPPPTSSSGYAFSLGLGVPF